MLRMLVPPALRRPGVTRGDKEMMIGFLILLAAAIGLTAAGTCAVGMFITWVAT